MDAEGGWKGDRIRVCFMDYGGRRSVYCFRGWGILDVDRSRKQVGDLGLGWLTFLRDVGRRMFTVLRGVEGGVGGKCFNFLIFRKNCYTIISNIFRKGSYL